jgi:hypothetical protein
MKVKIKLPKDFKQGVREVEIEKNGLTITLTEQEMDKAYSELQNAPLNEWHKKDDEDYHAEDWEGESLAEIENDRMVSEASDRGVYVDNNLI